MKSPQAPVWWWPFETYSHYIKRYDRYLESYRKYIEAWKEGMQK